MIIYIFGISVDSDRGVVVEGVGMLNELMQKGHYGLELSCWDSLGTRFAFRFSVISRLLSGHDKKNLRVHWHITNARVGSIPALSMGRNTVQDELAAKGG